MNTNKNTNLDTYRCFCQKSNGEQVDSSKHQEFSAWRSCKIRGGVDSAPDVAPEEAPTPTTTPAVHPDGCTSAWVETNAYGAGERSIGPVSSRAQCVEKVKAECPAEFDLANTQGSDSTGCWCQKSL